MAGLFLAILGAWIQLASAQFDRSTCGSGKGCITFPSGCQATGTCRMYFSYLQDGDILSMEIFGQFDQSRTQSVYYSVGFSDDPMMGDDTVIYCLSVNGVTRSGLAYNSGHTNNILNPQNIQAPSQAVASNGNIYCALRQLLVPRMQNVKDLNNSYYILAATGMPQADGRLAYHNNDKQVLSRIDLRQYVRSGNGVIVVPIQGTGVEPFSMQRPWKDWLKIIHACLMCISWGIFLCTGILFARHFKNHWPESTLCGVKLWFAYHRTLNTLGILLATAGAVAIFWAFDWKWMGPAPGISAAENWTVGPVHCLLGAISTVVMWIQPFNALCRCKPDSSARFIFNWIHRLIGLIGFIAALAAITVTALNFNTMYFNMDASSSIWIAYLALLILTEIILEVLKIKRWCTSSTAIVPVEEKEKAVTTTTTHTSGFTNAQSYVLLFFFLVAIILVGAMCVLIFLKPVKLSG